MVDLSIEKIGTELDKFLSTKTVVGEPIILGKVSLVPIQKASFGFGFGGGEAGKEQSSGGGSGAGVVLQPVAVVAVKEDGQVQIYSIGKKDTWEHVIESLPEMMSKVDVSKIVSMFKKEGAEKDKPSDDQENPSSQK